MRMPRYIIHRVDVDGLTVTLTDVTNSVIVSEIDNAPSVAPSRAEGEWIYIDEPIMGNPYGRYRCSECEMEKPHETDYCPNCGAKMKGADDE